MRHYLFWQASRGGGVEADDGSHGQEHIEKQDEVIDQAIYLIKEQQVSQKAAHESERQPVSPDVMDWTRVGDGF